MSRRDVIVLRSFAAWTIYVWVTRLWNIWRDDARDVPFKMVHTVLAAVSLAFAIATLRIAGRAASRIASRARA
jgi:hypothetical protein